MKPARKDPSFPSLKPTAPPAPSQVHSHKAQSPVCTRSKKPGKSLSASMLHTAKPASRVSLPTYKTRLPPLDLEALRLPKTHAPSCHQIFTLRRRFVDMSATLDRIPTSDWLGSLLCLKPAFSGALQRNLAKCRSRLAKVKIVREAIWEEEGEASEQSFLQETTYF